MPTFLSLPEKASSIAGSVNLLLMVMLAVGFLFAAIIAVLAFVAMFGRESQESSTDQDRTVPKWWSLGMGVVVILLFLWASFVYLRNIQVPQDAENVISVAKHWVWKFQHAPDGQGEIDELHVAVGQPVRLIMTSQDTTHSIFVPAFMQQQAILPGKFTVMWFKVTKPGEYPFYTTEYSGTGYTKMAGKIIALEPETYQLWLQGKPITKPEEGGEAQPPAGGEVALGEQIFNQQGCSGCHTDKDTPVAPTLHGIYGQEVQLNDGTTVTVDDAYLHESIVEPGAKVVQGYNDIMPKNYSTDLSEDQIQALIAYIKSLSGAMPEGEGGGEETGAAAAPGTAMELPADARAIFEEHGCNACHGQNLEGAIGPNLAGLSADYVKHIVRNGVEGTAMTAYSPDQISDENLDILAKGIESLSFEATGMKVNPTVAGHLKDAAAAFASGDLDATKAALEQALAACGQLGGQATLKTMVRKAEEGDTDYLKMRFDILLGGQQGEGEQAEAPAAEPTQETQPTPEPTQAAEPTQEAEAPAAPSTGEGDPVAGEKAFMSNGCNACHTDQDTPVAPSLYGIYGKEEELVDGSTVTVDDAYLQEAIVDPHAKLVKGYGPVMPPTYADLDPQTILDIIAYIRSLAP